MTHQNYQQNHLPSLNNTQNFLSEKISKTTDIDKLAASITDRLII